MHDEKEGYGKLTFSNGEYYAGEFKGGKPNGKGYFNGGCSFNGIWQEGELVRKL